MDPRKIKNQCQLCLEKFLKSAPVAVRLWQFQRVLKTRMILILNFTCPRTIIHKLPIRQ